MHDLPSPTAVLTPVFVVLIALEALLTSRRARPLHASRDTAASLTVGLGNLVSGWLCAGVFDAVYAAVYARRLMDVPRAWWAFALAFVGTDLLDYWRHRLSHEVRWLWATHVVHHSSRHLNFATAVRLGWTVLPQGSWLFWAPMILIGFDPPLVLFAVGANLAYQFWVHTELIGRLGWLEWVFNTPSHHRVHHAVNPRYIDRNFGGVLIVWDRLFGTFEPEADEEPCRYGLVDNIASYNPAYIALHGWYEMLRDACRSNPLRVRLKLLFGPPGWRPTG